MVRKFGFEFQNPLLGIVFLKVPDDPARLERGQAKQNTKCRPEDRLSNGTPIFFGAVDFDLMHHTTPSREILLILGLLPGFKFGSP